MKKKDNENIVDNDGNDDDDNIIDDLTIHKIMKNKEVHMDSE